MGAQESGPAVGVAGDFTHPYTLGICLPGRHLHSVDFQLLCTVRPSYTTSTLGVQESGPAVGVVGDFTYPYTSGACLPGRHLHSVDFQLPCTARPSYTTSTLGAQELGPAVGAVGDVTVLGVRYECVRPEVVPALSRSTVGVGEQDVWIQNGVKAAPKKAWVGGIINDGATFLRKCLLFGLHLLIYIYTGLDFTTIDRLIVRNEFQTTGHNDGWKSKFHLR